MPRYTFLTEQYLHNCWKKAYIEGINKVQVPMLENPAMLIVLYNKLQNYRRSIRTLRLNPLYKDEWNRIKHCSLARPKLGSSFILIYKDMEYEFKRAVKSDYHKHPFNKFPIPKGVNNVEDQARSNV
jgi:hypothetical protein